jgi:hypothetical protein
VNEGGIWEDATPLQRAELERMRSQQGVFDLALQLAVGEMLMGEALAVAPHFAEERLIEPEQVRTRCDEFIGKAAILVGGEEPDSRETLRRRAEYLQREINNMRRAMQHAGTWEQFCADYAAYERYRVEAVKSPGG